jgi:DNA-directed RNA polymerase specialized sigma24 family protein
MSSATSGTPYGTISDTLRPNEYAQAFETGFPATRRFLQLRGAPLEEAEEIAQAAWVRGWEYRSQLRDPVLVGYWVNSIARNLYRARFRAPLSVPLEPAHDREGGSIDVNAIELNGLLRHCSHRDRALVEKSLEGYSAEEIAKDAGITPTGIRVRLLRVRQALRRKIAFA